MRFRRRREKVFRGEVYVDPPHWYQLPAYGSRPTCIKCGHDEASTRWFLNKIWSDSRGGTFQHEELERTCCRCRWRWYEEPIDSPTAAERPQPSRPDPGITEKPPPHTPPPWAPNTSYNRPT